jgi:uncharacterized membrane protein YczE
MVLVKTLFTKFMLNFSLWEILVLQLSNADENCESYTIQIIDFIIIVIIIGFGAFRIYVNVVAGQQPRKKQQQPLLGNSFINMQ